MREEVFERTLVTELIQCQPMALTPNTPTWNPHTEVYRDQEYSMMNYRGEVKVRSREEKRLLAASVNQSIASVVTDLDAGFEAG